MSPTTGEVLLRLRCQGHPAIRATHGKTLEFAADSEITARATCVAGVGARVEDLAAPVIAGPVRLRLTAGGDEVVVNAIANPHWQPSEGIVVRRSGNRLPDTLATDADLAAADLPREFAARLHDPAGKLQVTVERAAGRATLVLLGLAEGPERLARLIAEAAAADLIVAEDPTARALLRSHDLRPDDGSRDRRGTPRRAGRTPDDGADSPGAIGAPARPGWRRDIADSVAAGGRVLVATSEALPGQTAYALLAEPGALAVEAAGLPPALAVAAASPSRAPVLVLDAVFPRELRGRLRDAPPATRLVFRASAADLPGLCRAATAARPAELVTLVRESPQYAEQVLRLAPEQAAGLLPAAERVVCCLDAAAGPGGAGDEPIRRLVAALAREQVSTRSIAAALAEVPGWSRNRAYEFVSGITARPGEEP